jgi:GABA(A) receptor-associated protein
LQFTILRVDLAGLFELLFTLNTTEMGNPVSKYKEEVDFDTRCQESRRVKTKYPGRIPIVVEKYHGWTNGDSIPDINKKKFLVKENFTMGHLMYLIRDNINIRSDQQLFLFCGKNELPPSASSMANIYDQYKDEDGFLYIFYAGESSFG